MRYAAQTMVSSERSKAEIESTLNRYGATAFGYATNGASAQIQFQAGGKKIRFVLPLPNRDDFKMKTDGRSDTPREQSPERAYADWEQACRQKWRALALVVKAKLEAVASEITTLEQEFMAHIVLPNGKTAGQHFLPGIDKAYIDGKVPAMGWEGCS